MVISDYKDKKKKLISRKKKKKLDMTMKDFPVDLILNWWVLETWK